MVNVKFNGELRSVTKKEFKRRDGSTGVDCKVLVECGVYSHTLQTTELVAQKFENGEVVKGNTYEFSAVYQPRFQFNNFVVSDIK